MKTNKINNGKQRKENITDCTVYLQVIIQSFSYYSVNEKE